jgi:hypothetical protein
MESGEYGFALLALMRGPDRPGEEGGENDQDQQPGHDSLARHHPGEGEQSIGVAVETAFAFGDPLDIDRNLVRSRRNRHESKQMAGDQNVAARGRLDRPGARLAAVQLDRKPLLDPQFEMAAAALDGRVSESDGEIGEVDVAIRAAADAERVAFDPRRPNDLAPVGAVGDGAENKSHAAATSNRRR